MENKMDVHISAGKIRKEIQIQLKRRKGNAWWGMLKYITQIFAATALLVPQIQAAITLTFFPVSAYDPNTSIMNATLGVTGYTIGNFETTTLIPGLTITLSNGVPLTTFTTLPNLFDQSVCGGLTNNSSWDGAHSVINTTTNTLSSCFTPANIANLATFNYAPGATSFGIGFGNFQSLASPDFPINNHELFVNGVDLGVIETLAGANWTAGLARNAYLRIDGTGGTSITSVAVQNLGSGGDVLVFDHVAVQTATPEPSSFGAMLLGVIFLVSRLRRRAS